MAPGMSSADRMESILAKDGLKNLMQPQQVSETITAHFADFTVSKDHPNYPQRSDLKIMRQDVLGLTICFRDLVEDLDFSDEELANIPLFTANSASIDHLSNQFEKFAPIIQGIRDIEDQKEKNKKIVKTIPPLLALRTLTNGAQSFASQYTKVKGGGTCFGVSSIGGFYALKEAFEIIKNQQEERVLVGSSNLAGPHSYLNYCNSVNEPETWMESTNAICFALESEKSLNSRKKEPLAEIQDLEQFPSVPSFSGVNKGFSGKHLKNLTSPIIFGGAFTKADYQRDQIEISKIDSEAFSVFPFWGNTGPSSLLLSMVLATEKLKSHSKTFTCLDYDPFGRAFSVKLNSNSI